VAIHVPTLQDVRATLDRDGKRPVLLYIDKGKKGPTYKNWEKTTYEQTQTLIYQSFLERYSNTGVLLGGTDNLCTLDCDTEVFLAESAQLNPCLASTLLSVGERAGQYWFYAIGTRPHKVELLKVQKDSPLALGAKKVEDDGTVKVGEFRAEGGQSIVRGIHPCGLEYRWFCSGPPIVLPFNDIVWPADIIIPWGKGYRSAQPGVGTVHDDSLLGRAIDALSIDELWAHFNYPPRNGNPVSSPFRDDRSPSFSVYDEGRRWKDHGNGDRGDSFDFYQRATGKNAKEAFKGFVELAGLGAELRHSTTSIGPPPGAAAGEPLLEAVRNLAIYYDPDRAGGCYWFKNDRDNWIKIAASDVVRHLEELGYQARAPKGQTLSETDRIVNQIQRSMDVEYAASLAGYQKGVLMFRGHRLLILDSPVFIAPAPGDWSVLSEFLFNLLGKEQLPYLYGWLKTALEALYNGKFRPGQALVLAGPKDCGKSLLQNLLTVLFGGRSAKPHQYMSGQTSFNGDLFCAEHLMMEDEEPATDIKARRNFGTKIKEVTANVTQRCHHKYRPGITLEPFWRLTISLNEETENLMILPPWDDSIEDKVILFKATSYEMPMPTLTNEDRQAFWDALTGSLPAFVDFLLKYEIPEKLSSHRYGITHFHHPDILEALGALAPETRFLELIDAEIFKYVLPSGRPTDPWEGTASKLELNLTDDISGVRYPARQLLSWQGACGTYLGRLQRRHPKRITFRKSHRDRIWKIYPP
jgi:hypothetical protein